MNEFHRVRGEMSDFPGKLRHRFVQIDLKVFSTLLIVPAELWIVQMEINPNETIFSPKLIVGDAQGENIDCLRRQIELLVDLNKSIISQEVPSFDRPTFSEKCSMNSTIRSDDSKRLYAGVVRSTSSSAISMLVREKSSGVNFLLKCPINFDLEDE